MEMKKRRGISLISLIIMIIVIVILVGAVILTLVKMDVIDSGKKAKFMNNFRVVEEGITLYMTSNIESLMEGKVEDKSVEIASVDEIEKLSLEEEDGATKIKKKYPVTREFSVDDRNNIKNTTLATDILEKTGKTSITEVNTLWWVDLEKIGVSIPGKSYLLDVETMQVYEYEGEKIKDKTWHTLDGGIGEVQKEGVSDEMWNGFITKEWVFPEGATEKKWRLSREGEVRQDKTLAWEDYTGPITIPLLRVPDVWIRYKINGEEVIVSPYGRVAVDIEPDSYYPEQRDEVKVKINYDKNAVVKEYKVGGSSWITYEGDFTVTENVLIEARAKKVDIVDRTEIESWGRDYYYVNNINIEENQELEAPKIKILSKEQEDEVAKVEVIYPDGASKKVYKVNYGKEIEYNEEEKISVKKNGTYVMAYYYDEEGNKSKYAYAYVGENSKTGEWKPTPPGRVDSIEPTYKIEGPEITINPTSVTDGSVEVKVYTPNETRKMYIKIGNGKYEEYTGPVYVNQNTTVSAYYITKIGERSDTSEKVINNIKVKGLPYIAINADPYPSSTSYGKDEVNVSILSEDATTVEYSLNGVEWIRIYRWICSKEEL